MNKKNWVVKEAHPKLMILLFENASFFSARAVLPDDLHGMTHEHFNLFDPTGGPHFAHGMIGSYKPSTDDALMHYEYITLIMRVAHSYTRDILMLGLVYNFMATVSEKFRRPLQSRKILRADRVVLRNEIIRLSMNQPYRGYHTMT